MRIRIKIKINIKILKRKQVELRETIATAAMKGAVEKWLLKVQEMMFSSIRSVISRSHKVVTCWVGIAELRLRLGWNSFV